MNEAQVSDKVNVRMMNPMIRKLYRTEEQATGRAASYHGVTAKTFFFMLVMVAGAACYFWLRPMLAVGEPILVNDIQIYLPEAAVILAALVISCFSPLLAFLIKPLVPVLGSMYCLTIGYAFTWVAGVMPGQFGGAIYAAVLITVVLVLTMTVLYTTGIVKVNAKFRSIVTTLFFTCVLTSLVGFAFSFIPGLKDLVALFMNNWLIGVVSGVIYIVVACAFLLVDFDSIHHAVARQLPKKYEWIAAFGLVYTIIFLFFKVLSLILTVTSKKSE